MSAMHTVIVVSAVSHSASGCLSVHIPSACSLADPLASNCLTQHTVVSPSVVSVHVWAATHVDVCFGSRLER